MQISDLTYRSFYLLEVLIIYLKKTLYIKNESLEQTSLSEHLT